jgi:hypothetical protein
VQSVTPPRRIPNVSGEPAALLSTTWIADGPENLSSTPTVAVLPVTWRHVTGPLKS